MKKIKRSRCTISGSAIHYLYKLKNFPVSMSCVDTDPKNDMFEDMSWGFSDAGHIQLLELLDPDLIYTNYHNPGTVGKIWQEHHRTFAEFIKRDKFSNTLEIGGSSGNLVKHFLDSERDFNWTIVEPSAKNVFPDNRVSLINGYFEDLTFNNKFDSVIHSHCFEHVYDPISFLHKIHSVLDYGDFHYISIPNMKYWLENGFSNTLHFEHTFYVDAEVLNQLLASSGFAVVDQVVNDHSIFVKAVKSKNIVIPDTDFSYVKLLFEKYISDQEADVAHINQQLAGQSCYIFGGHIFSQVLINLGLQQSQVVHILDNDPLKHGKRLYGTNCFVKSPKILEGVDNPLIVLRGGSYTNEIKNAILNINSTSIFL